MSAAGLRLDQAPPFSVPLRFFLTAPFFPLLAAALLAWAGPEALTSRWSPAMLALTHLFTLGFLAMVMIGALIQLLPVLAGSPVVRPRQVGGGVHVLLTMGVLLLSSGFLARDPATLRVALALLGSGLGLFIVATVVSLARASGNPTVNTTRLALLGLTITVTLGLGILLSGKSAWGGGDTWTGLHLGWGLIGWVGLLIMGVAYQVVPMFQLTPPYPAWMTRTLTPLLFALLLFWSAGTALAPRVPFFAIATDIASVLIGLGLAAFAAMTLRLQWLRHRLLPDVTTRFWQLAMASLLICVAMGIVALRHIGDLPPLALLLGVWMIVGFASSAIHGMLYKIVPFLVWLHLHNQDIRGTLPNMKEILPDTRTAPHLWIHIAALGLLTVAILHPAFWTYPAAAALALSYGWLAANLWSAFNLYRHLVRTRSPGHVA
jgi:hypothetical protein